MSHHCFGRLLGSLATTVLLLAPGAQGELAAWDQAQVTALAKELTATTDALYDTFIEQPRPRFKTIRSYSYYELKHAVWRLQVVARELVASLEKGEGREQTLAIYQNLMQLTYSARSDAAKVFVPEDVGQRAAAVRGMLNRLGPYYDRDFLTLSPHPNIEPRTSR